MSRKWLQKKTIVPAFILIAVAWFIPWVFLFYTGMILYFPYEADGKSRFARTTGPLVSSWTSSSDIPESCKAALVAAEDTAFYEHAGVDFKSLLESYRHNQKSKRIRGGSTISQQLVKNAFLSRERSYVRKAREITGTLLMNAIMSKDWQLTWYWNIVEFGPRVYGIKEAAQYYFKKKPEKLTPFECVSLVVIIPSPNKWNKSLSKKAYTGFFTKRYNIIVQRMRILGQAPAKQIAAAATGAPFYVSSAKPKIPAGAPTDALLSVLPDFNDPPDEVDGTAAEPVENAAELDTSAVAIPPPPQELEAGPVEQDTRKL